MSLERRLFLIAKKPRNAFQHLLRNEASASLSISSLIRILFLESLFDTANFLVKLTHVLIFGEKSDMAQLHVAKLQCYPISQIFAIFFSESAATPNYFGGKAILCSTVILRRVFVPFLLQILFAVVN